MSESNINMTVKDLREIIKNIPDDMDDLNVIIPVITEEDANRILAFRHVRTAGVLTSDYEEKPALCLNTASDGLDISSQIERKNDSSIWCDKVLF